MKLVPHSLKDFFLAFYAKMERILEQLEFLNQEYFLKIGLMSEWRENVAVSLLKRLSMQSFDIADTSRNWYRRFSTFIICFWCVFWILRFLHWLTLSRRHSLTPRLRQRSQLLIRMLKRRQEGFNWWMLSRRSWREMYSLSQWPIFCCFDRRGYI